MANDKLRAHNAAQISKWFEFRDVIIQKGTAGSYFNLQSDRRSESRVTLSERGHKSLDCSRNAHFRRHVLPILTRIEDAEIYKPARFLEHDPTALRRWRVGETKNDQEKMKDFDRLCKFVAVQLERAWPGIRVVFVVSPDEEEFAGTPGQHEQSERKWTRWDTFRKIDSEITQIMQTESCTQKAAIGLYRDRLERAKKADVSPRKIEEALQFVRDERDGAA